MSEEIQYLSDELDGLCKEVEKGLKEVEKKRNMKPEAKSDKVG
jgi:hypothetical protein